MPPRWWVTPMLKLIFRLNQPQPESSRDPTHDTEQRAVSPSTLATTAVGAAGAIAGWTLSSLGKRVRAWQHNLIKQLISSPDR